MPKYARSEVDVVTASFVVLQNKLDDLRSDAVSRHEVLVLSRILTKVEQASREWAQTLESRDE